MPDWRPNPPTPTCCPFCFLFLRPPAPTPAPAAAVGAGAAASEPGASPSCALRCSSQGNTREHSPVVLWAVGRSKHPHNTHKGPQGRRQPQQNPSPFGCLCKSLRQQLGKPSNWVAPCPTLWSTCPASAATAALREGITSSSPVYVIASTSYPASFPPAPAPSAPCRHSNTPVGAQPCCPCILCVASVTKSVAWQR